MKKWSLLTIFTLAIFVLAACSTAEPEVEAEPAAVTAVDSAEADAAMESHDDADMDDSAEDDAAEQDDMDSMEAEEAAHDDDAMMDEDTDSAEMMADDDAMADEEMVAEAQDEAMADDTETMADEPSVDLSALPAWQTAALTNARTGESFTLADFNGQTVFVEPMATWCSNCRKQLQNVGEARAAVGDDAVFIALSLETNINDAELADYAEQQGFDWTFAVMSEEILQLLADEFGRTIANAPSTPHFVIRPDGSFTDLVTGIESPEEIVEQLKSAMQS